jgi:hypothetical protein
VHTQHAGATHSWPPRGGAPTCWADRIGAWQRSVHCWISPSCLFASQQAALQRKACFCIGMRWDACSWSIKPSTSCVKQDRVAEVGGGGSLTVCFEAGAEQRRRASALGNTAPPGAAPAPADPGTTGAAPTFCSLSRLGGGAAILFGLGRHLIWGSTASQSAWWK